MISLEFVIFFLFAFLAGHTLFLSLILTLRMRQSNMTLLGVLLFLILLRVGKSVLSLAFHESSFYINVIGLSAMATMGPLLWVYIKSLFQLSIAKSKYLLISLIPALSVLFIGSWKWLNLGYYIITVHLLLYVIASAYFVINNRETFKTDNIRIKWAFALLIGFGTIWITFALQLFSYDRFYYLMVVITSVVLAYSLSLWAFAQQRLFTNYKDKNNREPEDYALIRSEIDKLFNEEIFVDASLNLTLLAKRLNRQPYLVSRVINESFKMTFPELLLQYRIRKAKELLHKSLNKAYTVEGIAYESGFSTLSAFYTAFKKETGMTPTQYKKQRNKIIEVRNVI
ncbi:MAG: AraC family transcriptional regulator [Cyclobacteriaceae bacterium]|nr:AraC family transcriptional regulator [Cyclobacteriaceae bacterium]